MTPDTGAATVSRHALENPLGSYTAVAMEPRAKSCLVGAAAAGGTEGAVAAGLLLAALPCPAPSMPRRVRAMCVAVSAVSS